MMKTCPKGIPIKQMKNYNILRQARRQKENDITNERTNKAEFT